MGSGKDGESMPMADERKEMTTRESFRAATHFREADHLLWPEYVPDSTIMQWIREGLPLENALSEQATTLSSRGGMIALARKRTLDVGPYFGFNNFLATPLEIELGPLPRFMPVTLDRGDDWVVQRTEHGVTQKLFLDGDFFMPQSLDFPVKTERDWEAYEKRLDPSDPRTVSYTHLTLPTN